MNIRNPTKKINLNNMKRLLHNYKKISKNWQIVLRNINLLEWKMPKKLWIYKNR